MRSGWKQYKQRAGGAVHVMIRLIGGVRWTAKLVPSTGPLDGWILQVWRETRLVDEQGAQLPGRLLRNGKRAAVIRIEQLAAAEASR